MATASPLFEPNNDANNTTDEESQLDAEIASIRAQIKHLSQRRNTLTSTLLGSRSTRSLLQRTKDQSASSPSIPAEPESTGSQTPSDKILTTALERASKQAKHSQTSLYRMCAGATMFEVRDPDPHAVDDRKVFGVRLEVCVRDKFLPPYYLLLNRPYAHAPTALRIHRHTVPPCIPLSALAGKYLPAPPSPTASTSTSTSTSTSILPTSDSTPLKPSKSRPQNLPRLVRDLRREIISYHLRRAALETLRDRCGVSTAAVSSNNLFAEFASGSGSSGPSKPSAPLDILNIHSLHDSRDPAATPHHTTTRTPTSENASTSENKIKAISPRDAEITDIQILWTSGRLARIKMQRNGKLVHCVVYGSGSSSGPAVSRSPLFTSPAPAPTGHGHGHNDALLSTNEKGAAAGGGGGAEERTDQEVRNVTMQLSQELQQHANSTKGKGKGKREDKVGGEAEERQRQRDVERKIMSAERIERLGDILVDIERGT